MSKSSGTNYSKAFKQDLTLSIYHLLLGDNSGAVHLFPFRTEKLSPPAQMVLVYAGRVCRRHF